MIENVMNFDDDKNINHRPNQTTKIASKEKQKFVEHKKKKSEKELKREETDAF